MKNRDDLVPESEHDKRCSLCYCGHVHTWGAHYKSIREHKQAEAKRDQHWLCLCGRVHVPDREWCPVCLLKRREGIDLEQPEKLDALLNSVLNEGSA